MKTFLVTLAGAVLTAVVTSPAVAAAEEANADGSTTTTTVVTESTPAGTTTTTTRTTTWPCADGTQAVTVETTAEGPAPRHSSRTDLQPCEDVAPVAGPSERRRAAHIWASSTSGYYGSQYAASIDLGVFTDDGPNPTGTAEIAVAGKRIATRLDSDGAAHVELPSTTPAGVHVVTIRYRGDDQTLPADAGKGQGPMAAPLKVRVEKASSRVLVSVPAKDRHSKRQVAVVHIRSHGAAAGGHVRVQVGSRKAMASVRNGVARVRLPKSRMGNKRIRVVYSGDRNHSAARRAVPVNVG